MRWGIFLAGALAVLFSGGQAEAQENAACDAACGVPCYFGSCAPALKKYRDALAQCSVGDLDLVARLYRGTDAAFKASSAADILRGQGYASSRIVVTPNNGGGNDCTALVEGGSGGGSTAVTGCADIEVPAGFRCVIENGRMKIRPASDQQAESARLQAERERLEADRLALQREREQIEAARAQQQQEASLRNPGLGPRPASGEAARQYDRCIAGDAAQCFNLGDSHRNGIKGAPRNDRYAVAAFQRACDGGDPRGCTNLGFMYDNGLSVVRDAARAVVLYREGCSGGDPQGCTNLGIMYGTGQGVTRNDPLAVGFFRQGCDGGSADGCSNLGNFYRVGAGVAKNLSQARIFLKKGCDGGSQPGCDKLKLLP